MMHTTSSPIEERPAPYKQFSYYEMYYVGIISQVEVWINHLIPPVSVFLGVPAYFLIMLTFAIYDLGLSRQVRFYYIAIAAMDCLSIVTFHMFEYVGFEFRPVSTVLPLPFNNEAFCKLSRWLWYSSVQSSAWTTMMFAIDRYNKIRKPLWSKFNEFSRKMAIATAVGIGVLFSSNGHVLAVAMLSDVDGIPNHECVIDRTELLGIIASYLLIGVPFTAYLAEFVCNLLLLITLKRIARRRLSAFESTAAKACRASVTATAVTVIVHGFMHALFNIGSPIIMFTLNVFAAKHVPMKGAAILLNFLMIYTFFVPAIVVLITFTVYFAKLNGFRSALLRLRVCCTNNIGSTVRKVSRQSEPTT